MRFDKFTTKFQQAVSDAQSLAVGHDNQLIEPQHLLLALLNQDDGGTTSLLARAGVNVAPLKTALDAAIDRLPKVEGHGGEVSHRPRPDQSAQPHRQGSAEGAATSSSPPRCSCWR